jgi:hypothetical protein
MKNYSSSKIIEHKKKTMTYGVGNPAHPRVIFPCGNQSSSHRPILYLLFPVAISHPPIGPSQGNILTWILIYQIYDLNV